MKQWEGCPRIQHSSWTWSLIQSHPGGTASQGSESRCNQTFESHSSLTISQNTVDLSPETNTSSSYLQSASITWNSHPYLSPPATWTVRAYRALVLCPPVVLRLLSATPVGKLNMQILRLHPSSPRVQSGSQKPDNKHWGPRLEKYLSSRLLWNINEEMKASRCGDLPQTTEPANGSTIWTLSFWPKVTRMSTPDSQLRGPQGPAYSAMPHHLSPLPKALFTKMEQNQRKIRIWGKNYLNEH